MSSVATRIHHVGIPVTNLERSLAWYTEVIGAVDTGLRGGGAGEVISQALQVEGADVQVGFLRIGDQIAVELVEYATAGGRSGAIRNNDIGAIHVCFEVDDIDEAYRRLGETSAILHHEPISLDETAGDLAGHKFLYFRDPDGITLELFELPQAGDAR